MRVGRIGEWVARFTPGRTSVGRGEQMRAFAGAGVGILLTSLLARWSMAGLAPGQAWIAAPLGASAVLVFAVPASPLAQPWAVVGGNVLSALVGSTCALLIGDPALAGSVAVAAAIAAMFVLRCLHPPGGATALLAAMGGAGYGFAMFPMLADSLLLVAAGVLYNSLTGRPYPPARQRPPDPARAEGRFSAADLDAALAHYDQVLDVSRDDLEQLLQLTEAAAYQRQFGQLVCADIMSREVVSAQFGTPLEEAWTLMRQRRIKALPIVDRTRRVVGIVTVADFLEHAGLRQTQGLRQRLGDLLRRAGAVHSEKPETVGQIMTREVRVASADRRVAELVPLFSEDGHHHIPIIDSERRLVGVITQSDLVRALYRAARVGGGGH
ncbi:MAG: HPP family protein [Comamonadaceae bacterium]|nr:MAG: HPP family protein [Comamonadaceae bacterium]